MTASERGGDLAEIKALLQARIEDLARTLAPRGKRSGNYWMAANPARDDRKPGSFWIALRGAPGAWRDEATGDKGDVITLVRYCQRLANTKDALAWARDWLGIARMDPGVMARQIAVAQRRAAESHASEAAELAKKRRGAFAMWIKGRNVRGTVADTYLQSRGINIGLLPRQPGLMRFLDHHPHAESREPWPCLITGMTDGGNTVLAVHRIWLARDGSDKAPVTPQRKIWPAFRGLYMPLARGETGLPVAEAAKHGLLDTLVLTEGVEDALSVAVACPQYRVWAVGSLGNLQHITLPACAADVIVAADNDWGKPQAHKALQQAIDALVRQGKPVRIARSPLGKDVNDALRGAA
jgi:hypothetical protein